MKRENFLKDQRATPPPVLHKDLSGKTVLVIGATAGLGFEACLHFSRMNPAKLIMTARSQQKAQDALHRVAQETSYKATAALVDLDSFDSIRKFCDHISETNPSGVDIVLIGAGLGSSLGKYNPTREGWQNEMQVNHISAAWIAVRLLPVVAMKPEGRIVMVPTDLHHYTTIEDDLVNDKEGILRAMSRKEYFDKQCGLLSLVVSLLFMRALVAHFPSTSPTHPILLGLEPGFCSTNLGNDIPRSRWMTRLLLKTIPPLLALPAEVGGRNFVFGCLAGEQEFGMDWRKKIQGGYLKFSRISAPSDFVEGKEGQVIGEQILNETIALLRGLDAKVDEPLRSLGL
ncbi:hypothetical protein DL96DRAFT_1539697 [Flagelloscypha sp. PMI_526]|nr:hypothetical protein DL96DRAFT_1539697 [Flagelloscypha sp. PMI_526]